jgi:hypothetical protein
VNRHKYKAITADISNTSGGFKGNAEASLVAGREMQDIFEFDKQGQSPFIHAN